MMAKKDEHEKLEVALLPKEDAFAKAFGDVESATYGQATESAKRAGFSAASARTSAWRLLRRPRVKNRLREIYAESDFSEDRIMSNIAADRLKAIQKGDIATAVRCDELLGKKLGLFSDRLIQTFEDPGRQHELDASEQHEAMVLATLRLRLPAYAPMAALPNGIETAPKEQANNDGEQQFTGCLRPVSEGRQIAGEEAYVPPS